MEVELFSNVVSEEDTFEIDAENDNFGVDGERCGICMDVVVDRGVLDCCQHWFCFVCIDNWATITNLCPLCQNEFQLITCVPVYDTIGSSKTDEDADSGDDDWRVQGKNNTLSFPSYYIDENAVTCLDGDCCKIRSGSVNFEENLTLDTSIACDSCDIWYHAFCVGFDPEGTGVDSWLCPRCLVNETQKKSDFKETRNTASRLNSENANHQFLVDAFSGKVSISVADAGETAVVVSRLDEHAVKEPSPSCLSTGEVTSHHEIDESMSVLGACSSELGKPLDQGINDIQPEPTIPSGKLHETIVKIEPIESESRICLELGSSLDSTLPVDDEKTKILVGGDECSSDASDRKISVTESLGDVKAHLVPKISEKRKRAEHSIQANDEDGLDEVRLASGSSARKLKTHRGTRRTSLNDRVDISASDDIQKTKSQTDGSLDEIEEIVQAKKIPPVDIMSIVQGTESRTTNRLMHQKELDKCAKVQKKAARLRVKKIMRRPSDDKESADVVQKLRKEIREAVRKKPSDDIGKSIFDPNLLAAFRAAVAGSVPRPVMKASPATVKAKKLILQKGKTRENLTKKIYATFNGKRRRAWDRDCQVEFWKHRCIRTTKAEKIETLKSVLNLLRKSPESKHVEQNTDEEAKAPILSRLYLADASVFPRKDDIKPLSVLKAAANSKQNEDWSFGEKDAKPCPHSHTVKSPDRNEVPRLSNISIADDKKNSSSCVPHNNAISSGKLRLDGQPNDLPPQKKVNGKTDDAKFDKRKWALEVLARKTASNSASSVHQNQDNALLKGNCPLLVS